MHSLRVANPRIEYFQQRPGKQTIRLDVSNHMILIISFSVTGANRSTHRIIGKKQHNTKHQLALICTCKSRIQLKLLLFVQKFSFICNSKQCVCQTQYSVPCIFTHTSATATNYQYTATVCVRMYCVVIGCIRFCLSHSFASLSPIAFETLLYKLNCSSILDT